jgi:hypothetical protein
MNTFSKNYKFEKKMTMNLKIANDKTKYSLHDKIKRKFSPIHKITKKQVKDEDFWNMIEYDFKHFSAY